MISALADPADKYRYSFLLFVVDFWESVPGTQKLKMNWHIEVICEELQKIAFRIRDRIPKEGDFVCNQPPGTSKSSCFSILFPAWVWTWFPECRFICASHTDSLVHDLAYKCRAVILSDKYQELFPNVRLRKDRIAIGDFANTLGGERKSCTVGGASPTGRHADLVIVDDAINPQKALSEVELKNASYFMTGVVPSRVTDKEVSVTILVMQRVHQLDPTGVMLEESKKEGAVPVRLLCLPATDSELTTPEYKHYYHEYNEYAKCESDGVMDPSRLNKKVLKQIYAKLGSYEYAGQFDQNPVPLGGGVFKEIYFATRKRAAPYNALRLWYVDTAVSETDASCETAMTLMAKDEEGGYWIEKVIRGHWEPTDRDKQMKIACQYTARRYPNQQVAMWVEREPGGSGKTAFQYIAKHLAGFVVKPHNPRGKKEVRAAPFASQAASGNVFLVDDGCLVAGTMISTIDGNRSIETIEKGDFVLTREGYREVLQSGETKKTDKIVSVLFSNGFVITGTHNHPVWTENRGWVDLEDCNWYDTMISLPSSYLENLSWENVDQKQSLTQKLLYSKEKHSLGRLGQSISTAEEQRDSWQEWFGNSITDLFPIAVISTTKTATQATTTFQIWNALLDKNTLTDIPIGEDGKDKKSICKRYENLLSNGIKLKKARKFIRESVKKIGIKEQQKNTNANSAESILSQREQKYDFVLSNVQRNSSTIQEDIGKKENVLFVESCLNVLVKQHEAALKNVKPFSVGIPVYNLTVNEVPEFYANGILVHNSWDCNDWVKTVILFPMGRLKDIVDSASGAFSLLLNTQETRPILRMIRMGSPIKKGKMRVIVCSKEELGRIVDKDHNTILLSITNPFPVGVSEIEPVGFEKLQDSILLPFLDADPSEYQENYSESLPEYERPAHDLLMTQDHGKRLWRSLLQKRDKILEQIVVADDGIADRRGVSVAYAICDILRLNRKDTIYFASDHQENSDSSEEERIVDGKAPNEHVYRTTKNSRGMVIT